MRIETKVGVFVVIALFMLFGLTTQVGSFKFGQKSGYPMIIQLDNANGLEKNANVKSRGIVIGYIDSFSLDVDSVKVNSVIYDGYKIPKGSIASIKQESMLGVKYIDIEFSNEKTFIAYNAELSKNKTYASFDDMSNSINDAATSFNIFIKRLDDLIAKNEKNFTQLIANFKDVGAEFKQTGIDINKKLPSILEKFETVGNKFAQTGKTINEKLPRILDKFENVEDGINGIISDNKENLKSAIKNIDSAFENVDTAAKSVENAFDKVDQYLSSTTKSTLGVQMKVEDIIGDENTKTYFGVDYSPKPTIHYLVDIISSDDYRDNGSGKPVTTDLHQDGRTLISAQYGKDFNNLRLRAGIIESTGGFGIDYYMYNQKLKYTFEAFDFNAYNDVRGDKAHLKTYLEYTMKKHLLLYMGMDNFLNTETRKALFGIGIRFEDNDLKYLLGSAAASFN